MSKFIRRSQKVGLPPGSLVHLGEKRAEKIKISLIDYNENNVLEKEIEKVDECFPFKDKPSITWINIDGLHCIEVIEKLGEYFGVHPLLLEDIVNTGQRPKIEDFESYLFMVVKMFSYNDHAQKIQSEQFSLILGQTFVISFQEEEGDVFNPVRERIRNAKGRIRKMGADYLAYSLLDALVDEYFVILEKIAENIEDLEDALIINQSTITLQEIHNLKREMIYLRKSVWPLREVVNNLERGESALLQKSTRIYFRDLYDHTIQVIDSIEVFRDLLSGMLDLYLSSISNRMNEVMKVLTIFASIFIPLTFIAGVYGMNFKYLPELEWAWEYPAIWVIMIIITIFMLFYFRKKKWL